MRLRGQCPECVVRENDYSEKRLYRCKFCERHFCHRHLTPRLVEIPSLKYASQDVDWQKLVEMADRRKSHPDFQFTRQKFSELVAPKEEKFLQFLGDRYCFKCGSRQIKPSEEALYYECLNCGNRWKLGERHGRAKTSKPELKPSDTMQPVRKKSSPKIDNCPKCGSERIMTTAYREQYDAFECLGCQYRWKHFHRVPDKRPNQKRKTRKKERITETLIGLLIGCVIALVGVGIVIWEIYNPLFWTIIFVWFIPIPLILIGGFIVILGVIVAVGSLTTYVGSLPSIKKIVALLLIVMSLGIVLWNVPSIFSTFQKLTGLQPSSTYNHEELVTYALSLINSDRSQYGISNVSLSSVDSGQQHADNMLKYHFFSHWDVYGYKPYMRYTLAGGQGSVAENVAGYPSKIEIIHYTRRNSL